MTRPPGAPAARDLASDAVEFQPDAQEIDARPVPVRLRLTLYVILGLMVTAVVWATLARVDRVVTSHGKLIATGGRVVVQPIGTSVVRRIVAQVGQVVQSGQVVVTLDPTFAEADLSELQQQLAKVSADIARMEAELGDGTMAAAADSAAAADGDAWRLQARLLERRRAEYDARLAAFRENIAMLEASIDNNKKMQEHLASQLKIFVELEGMRKDLYQREHGSKLNLLEARQRRLELETERERYRNEAGEILHKLASTKAEREAFKNNWFNDVTQALGEARTRRDGLVERIAKARRLNALVELRSPVDGVVLEVAQRSQGSVVKEAEPLVTLMPLDSPLEVEAEIDAKDIGFVRAGDAVRIKLDAFPFQRHGTLDGRVRTISEDAFSRDTEGGRGAPFYRARVELTSRRLDNVPAGFRLIPGMTATAEIKVGTRSVISFFAYPVIRALDESMREP
ncbi:MAG: HlyD family type I secretion periplasmic adaptor subunit [Hyphomicrobiales bacterium]|nr:HlyD family type I secretion periplasmic adaptor subunit [Hyphomicrobiales bacterium]MCP5372289.1 HlyD family type I secretion periplasmic adaptor subunit [Hyphomicrobiales bacterium]